MLKLSLRSESCKHSCMLWGASAINPGKANRFGFDPWGDLFFVFSLEVIHHAFQIYLFASSFQLCFSFITLSATSSFLHSISQYASPHHFPSLSLWRLPMRSVVGGLMFSQVGEGHFSQMDMSCGAMPSQLRWREPWGLEQSKPGRHWERGEVENYLWPGEAAPLPGPSWSHGRDGPGDKEMERVKNAGRVDVAGKQIWKKKKKMNKKREREKLYTMDCGKPDGLCTKAHFGLQNYIWHSGAYVLGVIHTDTVCCCGFSGMLHTP